MLIRISTWADGFGNWHAKVPLSNDPKSDRHLAQAAILWELNARSGPARVTRKAVPVVLVSEDIPNLTAEYKEDAS